MSTDDDSMSISVSSARAIERLQALPNRTPKTSLHRAAASWQPGRQSNPRVNPTDPAGYVRLHLPVHQLGAAPALPMLTSASASWPPTGRGVQWRSRRWAPARLGRQFLPLAAPRRRLRGRRSRRRQRTRGAILPWPGHCKRPNYDADSVAAACDALASAGLRPQVMVDVLHANGEKQHQRQIVLAADTSPHASRRASGASPA